MQGRTVMMSLVPRELWENSLTNPMLVLPDFFPPDGSDMTSQLLEDAELQKQVRLCLLFSL